MSSDAFCYDGDIPLSDNSGYHMVDNIVDSVKQNFKMLLLTIPGERAMDTEFGVGVQKYLFEMQGEDVYANLDAQIRSKAAIYFPYLTIDRVQVSQDKDNPNRMNLNIKYTIPRLSVSDWIQILLWLRLAQAIKAMIYYLFVEPKYVRKTKHNNTD